MCSSWLYSCVLLDRSVSNSFMCTILWQLPLCRLVTFIVFSVLSMRCSLVFTFCVAFALDPVALFL